jgi:uncharacterized protein YukJ
LTIRRYSLFTGRIIDRRAETRGNSPHYQVLLAGGGERFRVAVNTRSGTSHAREADLIYFADDDFRHEITERLTDVADGWRHVESRPRGLALDYQRGGMFDRRQMRRIPASKPGPRNDLVDELDDVVTRLMTDPAARLHAFGTRWGPEPDLPDQIFGFLPGNGIHDVHMNQGNADEHWRDNGVWSDGGLIFHEPERARWSAIFLAFQSQSWRTDDRGDPTPYPRHDDHPPARIVGAFIHPNERKEGVEHVSIRNETEEALNVAGWRVRNRDGDELALEGHIPPRAVRRFTLPSTVPLSNRGGRIRLVDNEGNEIDSVAYTRHEARRKHGSLTF